MIYIVDTRACFLEKDTQCLKVGQSLNMIYRHQVIRSVNLVHSPLFERLHLIPYTRTSSHNNE